jgi:hypothetical protein
MGAEDLNVETSKKWTFFSPWATMQIADFML